MFPGKANANLILSVWPPWGPVAYCTTVEQGYARETFHMNNE